MRPSETGGGALASGSFASRGRGVTGRRGGYNHTKRRSISERPAVPGPAVNSPPVMTVPGAPVSPYAKVLSLLAGLGPDRARGGHRAVDVADARRYDATRDRERRAGGRAGLA